MDLPWCITGVHTVQPPARHALVHHMHPPAHYALVSLVTLLQTLSFFIMRRFFWPLKAHFRLFIRHFQHKKDT
jgi:hypothetical protein